MHFSSKGQARLPCPAAQHREHVHQALLQASGAVLALRTVRGVVRCRRRLAADACQLSTFRGCDMSNGRSVLCCSLSTSCQTLRTSESCAHTLLVHIRAENAGLPYEEVGDSTEFTKSMKQPRGTFRFQQLYTRLHEESCRRYVARLPLISWPDGTLPHSIARPTTLLHHSPGWLIDFV